MSSLKGSSGQAGTTVDPMMGSSAAQGKKEAASLTEKVCDTAAGAWQKTEELAGDVRDTAVGAWHKTEDLAAGAANKVKSSAQSVAHGAENAYAVTKEKAGEFAESLTGMIRRNPLPALLVGLGLGFLVGNLLSRR